jgi:lipoate-protein ligase A
MQILKSASDSPAYNCALEESLLTERPGRDVLLFYINRPSVIVGRNQEIAAEANVAYCRANRIEIVKRISGGGAVYHDYGNINYAFITGRGPAAVLDTDFTAPVIAALQSFGIRTIAGHRRDLWVDGRKISGTASCVSRGRILFHGTLLHRTDLARLSCALQGDRSLRGKGIASVPSPVVNLSDITGTTESTDCFLTQLIAFFSGYYQCS